MVFFLIKNVNNDEIKEFRAFYKYFNVRLNTEDTPSSREFS